MLGRQRSGQIVNIGSLSGLRGAPGLGVYSATKHGCGGLTRALPREVASFGIDVMVVEPGTIRRDFLARDAIVNAAGRIADYDIPTSAAREVVTTGHRHQLGDPDRMVAVIAEALAADEVPMHLPLGGDSVSQAHAKLEAMTSELTEWRNRAIATDHLDGDATPASA